IKLQNYFSQEVYTDQFSFANQLNVYIDITGLKKKDFADNISLHPTKLSRLVKGVDSPNIDLMFRLAIHSNDEIPAFYWWRLYARELEDSIRKDIKRKVEETEKVKSSMKFRA
ncbi:MAG: helix-turn-helix domain-containing protein, partial [Lewinella sp.]